jgi:glycosyltransferase involved in cell wall biosynthesis
VVVRVAIDARRLQDDPLQGVGRILANLVPHLARRVEVVLLFDRRRPAPSMEGCTPVFLAGLGRLPEIAWAQISVPWWLRNHGVSLLHGPYNTVPFAKNCPSVVSMHDLAWEHHPEYYSTRVRSTVLSRQAAWSARHSQAIVTGSEFTRAAIVETYQVPPERVIVAPNAVDPIFTPEAAGRVESVLGPRGVRGPYVVALGGAARRGLRTAALAWALATESVEPAPQLVTVGPEKLPESERVINAGRLTDAEWAAVLAGAEAFCYPTEYEGYGMPALEALAAGTPVVCAPVASLPEVVGDTAEFADSTGVTDVAAALGRLLSDPGRAAERRRAGLERAASMPTWADCAQRHMEAYLLAAS